METDEELVAAVSNALQPLLDELQKGTLTLQFPEDVENLQLRAYFTEKLKMLVTVKVCVTNVMEEDEVGSPRERFKGQRILSQEEILKVFWHLFSKDVCNFVNEMVANFVKELTNSSNKGFICCWPPFFKQKLNPFMKMASSACRFLDENFADLYSSKGNIKTIGDYIGIYLVGDLIFKAKVPLEDLIDEILNILRVRIDQYLFNASLNVSLSDANEKLTQIINEDDIHHSLLKFLQLVALYRETRSSKSDVKLKNHFIKSVQKSSDLLSGVPNEYYIKSIKKFVIREQLLSELIGFNMRETVKKNALEFTLLDVKRLGKLMPYLVVETRELNSFRLLKDAYYLAGRANEFIHVLGDVLENDFRHSSQNSADAESLLSSCALLRELNDPLCDLILKQSMRKIFGGDLRLVDPLLKVADQMIRRSYKKLHTGVQDANAEDEKLKLNTLYAILEQFGLVESFYKLFYERILFRRIILMSDEFLKLKDNSDNLESYLLSDLAGRGRVPEAVPQLMALTNDLDKSQVLVREFQSTNAKLDFEFVPLIFERKNVPLAFQRDPTSSFALPASLGKYWDDFASFYKNSSLRYKSRILNPQTMLHHFEVESPFTHKSKPLILELSLIQLCVLEVFNDREICDYEEMKSLVKFEPRHVDVALASFTSLGLLKHSNNRFTLNAFFKPDPKKIKDGKFRIAQKTLKPLSGSFIQAGVSREGFGAWKGELLKACIVRALKGAGDLTADKLSEAVEQKFPGFSVGDFKAALSAAVDFYDLHDNVYYYKP
ncbi:LAMI_0H11056g1_1 [Lachancea mirantina]|uniref:LAMI_0H11056g1_1 n=1 Tax=Lachancea mirantina TaxID=1230905 RepID=A0A1G4KH57_9SACH|nr:LAMI_0H11056g1_1 [Lachancea mirantina]